MLGTNERIYKKNQKLQKKHYAAIDMTNLPSEEDEKEKEEIKLAAVTQRVKQMLDENGAGSGREPHREK